MSISVNVDLFVKDELEWEVRFRGRKPQESVVLLRKQLREALASGEAPSGRVILTDVTAEVELCSEKFVELLDLAEGLQSAAPTSTARQRVRQRLQHVLCRLQNAESQATTSELEKNVVTLREQVAMALREFSLGQRRHVNANPGSSSSSVETAARVEPPVHVPAFSDMATASYHKLPNPCLLYTSRCV